MYPKRSKEYPDGDFLKTEREHEDEKYQVNPKGEVNNVVKLKDLYQLVDNLDQPKYLCQLVESVESETSKRSEL